MNSLPVLGVPCLPMIAMLDGDPGGRGQSQIAGGLVLGEQLRPTDPQGTATLTLQGLPTGTDLVVLAAGTATVLAQVDAYAGTSYPYAYSFYSGDTVVDIGFIKTGYVPFYIRNLTLPKGNALLPIALTLDRNFS